jgi:hypothetical protein
MSDARQAWMRRLLLPLMAAGALALAGCRDCGGCGPKPVLAELIEASGGLVRTGPGDSEASWKNADPGRRFEPGDSLRTDEHSSAKLRLPDGTVVIVHPATLIRFRAAEPGESPIEVLTGEAIVTAGDRELKMHTHVGLAILRPGGSLRVARDGEALQLQLDVGQASFRRDDGEEVALTRGERVRIEVGRALIRERDPSKLGDAGGAGGTPPPSAAVQMHVDAAGVRSKNASDGGWVALPAGDHPVAGETDLSLPAGTSVELTRERDRVKLLGAGDYRVGGHDLVWARRGKLLLSARSYDVSVAMADGWIVAPAAHGGSDAELELSDRAGSLKVTQGAVRWQRGSEQGEATPEHPLRWSLDDNAAAIGTEETDLGPPSLSSRAGESFVLHAPQLPVTLEIDFSRACHGGMGMVELNTKKRARGQGKARISVNTDARSYSVRCMHGDEPGPVAVRGSVRVLKDAGTRDLPPKAPTSAVETDGRSYTIYYQNQLPAVHVRWPDAPSAKQYKLDVDGTTQTTDAPEHTFASGSLRDGAHKITFSANQRRSRTSNVEIHFDNAATTASLSAPADRSFHAGDKVEIEGVALPSWKVSVDGGMIDKIGEDRFHGEVVTSEQHPDIAVRLAHPRLGTHYYLRRAAGSP